MLVQFTYPFHVREPETGLGAYSSFREFRPGQSSMAMHQAVIFLTNTGQYFD